MGDKTLESDLNDDIIQQTPEVSARNQSNIEEKSLPKNRKHQVACEVLSVRTQAHSHEEVSSDIDLPDMFEFENWWVEAGQPMTDEQLSDFLKQNL